MSGNMSIDVLISRLDGVKKTGAHRDNCNDCLNWHGLLIHVQQCRQYRGQLR